MAKNIVNRIGEQGWVLFDIEGGFSSRSPSVDLGEYLTESFGWWNVAADSPETPANSPTLMVSPEGDDSYTREQVLTGLYHWRTPQRAAWGAVDVDTSNPATSVPSQAAQAGETILVAPGVYQHQRLVPPVNQPRRTPTVRCANDGTQNAPITIKAMHPAAHTENSALWSEVRHTPYPGAVGPDDLGGPAFGATGDASGQGPGKEWIIVNGFYVDEEQAPAHRDGGLFGMWTCNHIAFRNNRLRGHPDRGYGNNAPLMWLDAFEWGYVQNNLFPYTRSGGFNAGNSPCVESYGASRLIVEHNTFRDSTAAAYTIKGNINTGVVIRRNWFEDCPINNTHGIIAVDIDRFRCYQNVFLRSGGPVFQVYNTFTGGSHSDVFNNLFIDSVTATYQGLISYAGQEFFDSEVAQIDNRMYNNIFATVGYPVGYAESSLAIFLTKNNLFEYNHYWNTEQGRISRFGSDYRTFEQWQTLGFDSDSPAAVYSDPLLEDSVGGDYRLSAGSPAIGTGRDISGLWGTAGGAVNKGPYMTGQEQIGLIPGAWT